MLILIYINGSKQCLNRQITKLFIMLNKFVKYVFILFSTVALAQTGHVMQGVGAVNMSMGGAATAQPLDISGAMQWNPAALSVFSGTKLKLDAGAFFSSPELYSTVPTPEGPFSGSTEDDRGTSILPALAVSWGKEDSKHTFGVSAFGISGFGVTFPENMSNPINMPQSMGGFGRIESDYSLLQVGFTWAYQISDKFSIGLQPNFDYATLSLEPNPLAAPDFPPEMGGTGKGYPKGDATAVGFGGQVGLFFDSLNGFKFGLSYKSQQYFNELDFENEYLDGSDAPGVKFTMNYPAIYSVGLGYSKGIVDIALDYRYIDYENTDGFKESGWTITESGPMAGFPTGAVNGFGWQNISVVSAGLQLSAINRLPLRFGYTYSTNPINEDLAFFSVPATAVIAHAFQFGFSYEFSDTFVLDAVYHYGMSDGKTSGPILNPQLISASDPLGAVPGSEVAYDMTTSMIMVGLNFNLGGKDTDGDGVKDKDDLCPEVAGLEQFNGCPDSDGDGIQDSEDECPNEAGLAAFNGCPDSDGDGFPDKEDMCPEVAGLEQFNGCPDTDGDGVMDKNDACPDEAGPVENKGCPIKDADQDGVVDAEDKCPNVYGLASNYGCPMITEETQTELTNLARAIYFRTGRDSFTDETSIRLEGVSKILSEYKDVKFVVEGHTDSTGSDKINNELSQKRADAVMNYLIENGFPAENIRAVGYGSAKPIGDNSTSKGRQQNRRVEIFAEKM